MVLSVHENQLIFDNLYFKVYINMASLLFRFPENSSERENFKLF